MKKPYPLQRLDLFAWCLAILLPAIWIALVLFFPQLLAIIIYMLVALAWVLMDRTNLTKSDIKPPSFIWFWFPGVYLRQRDQMQKKPWRLMQVWLLCTVLSFVVIHLFKENSGTDNLAQNACGLVTKILSDEGYDERCIRVTNMKEEVKDRFWKAQALLNTGVQEPVTIEVRGKNIYVVLPDTGE